MKRLQQWVSLGLCALFASPFAYGQQAEIGPVMARGGVFGRYSAPIVPPIRLSNSARVRSLIQGGKLYLTAQDAIALALENNIDIESDRYNATDLGVELHAASKPAARCRAFPADHRK